jgi:glutamine---fructose-6-phosphate transaminase (isomerizing)
MCGIAGYCLNPADHINAQSLTANLLMAIERRGTDATGMAWKDGDKYRVSKMPIPATEYVVQRGQEVPTDTRLAILHTRLATQGSPKRRENNHPIVCGPVVGVHNGHVLNDSHLFTRLGVSRRGQVDSEAAFALLAHTQWQPEQILDRLQGRAALAWLDRRTPNTLHLARVEGSPLAIGQTPKGSLIFASTAPLLLEAATYAGVEMDWVEEVHEYTYLRVVNGMIASSLSIVGKPDKQALLW